jgi:Icc-related predicted phosphoesterase
VPALWGDYLKPGHQVIDGGRAVVIGGGGGRAAEEGGRAGEEGGRVGEEGGRAGEKEVTFGFAGAGLISPYRTPNEIPPTEFEAKLDAIGAVDVLCTHIPPAIPELLYDTVARRMETGSTALLDLIRRTQPRYALFGHVHNPLARRVRVGRTECVNVGHFRATRAPYVIDL